MQVCSGKNAWSKKNQPKKGDAMKTFFFPWDALVSLASSDEG
jgi:hypothetical protein